MHVRSEIQFSAIPIWVVDSGISGKAIKLYLALNPHLGGEDVFLGRGAMADRLGWSTKKVERAMDELVACGAIGEFRKGK